MMTIQYSQVKQLSGSVNNIKNGTKVECYLVFLRNQKIIQFYKAQVML